MRRLKVSTRHGLRFVDPDQHQAEQVRRLQESVETLAIMFADYLYTMEQEPEERIPEGLDDTGGGL